MKKWNTPNITELNISETAKHVNQGNGNSKTCIFDPTDTCNAVGSGKGICKNCPNNPDYNTDSSDDNNTNNFS